MARAGKSCMKIRQRQLNEISWEEKFLLSFSFPKRIRQLELDIGLLHGNWRSHWIHSAAFVDTWVFLEALPKNICKSTI